MLQSDVIDTTHVPCYSPNVIGIQRAYPPIGTPQRGNKAVFSGDEGTHDG